MSKKNLAITIYVDELLYDIKSKSHLIGKATFNGQNYEQVSNIQDTSDENEDVFLRCIGNAYGILRTRISEYIIEDGTTSDNVLISATKSENGEEVDNSLTFGLRLPSNYSLSSRDGITSAIHEYIVGASLSEWLTSVFPSAAAPFAQEAQSALIRLTEALGKRIRPTRVHTPSKIYNNNGTIVYE